jgi:CheY-like chemotaxis protein
VASAEVRGNPDPAARRPIVLVVEDDVLIRLVIAEELRSLGVSVAEAFNAEEALAILQSSVSIDLVFTDVRMPGSMDGLALARSAREMHPRLTIVVTSALVPAAAASAFVDAFFAKPYDTVQVAQRIQDLLAGVKS